MMKINLRKSVSYAGGKQTAIDRTSGGDQCAVRVRSVTVDEKESIATALTLSQQNRMSCE
jgi:hypothetical protein